jgi:RNA polymerase sigma-70 factor (ECF subfamily)
MAGRFVTTHWSLIAAAGEPASQASREALEALCQVYWLPLYAFARQRQFCPEDAQDLTQEFFAQLLEKNYLRAADRERGRFRTYLLAAFKHFLANQRKRSRAQKRGGSCTIHRLAVSAAEDRYCCEPVDIWTPERVFERSWALTLLDRVLSHLQEEHANAGKSLLFDQVRIFLTGEAPSVSYSQIALTLGTTDGAVRVAIHRLRRRFREMLRAEIAQTVDSPDEVDDELHHLFTALQSTRPQAL